MKYQVLARKWRPHLFTELVGQYPVVRALTHALQLNRLHHAFLFTGTRGVGKTTIARIFAKALNCETGVTAEPCGHCNACIEIDAGRFLDLIEVDAASRTKVEDTRDLLDNVQYAPTRGRYKVYLIDEVHMLSNHSFNALLKTLEEPPPHVKFLLATTDPQKLPVTVLSRCLQFNLKRLSPALITQQLQHILAAEAISAEPAALQQIAHAADGSLRDALSLLDQAIAYTSGQIDTLNVQEMLGNVAHTHIHDLLTQLATRNGKALLAKIHHLAEQAVDFNRVLDELMQSLHRIALAQVVPDSLDDNVLHQDTLRQLATELSPEQVQLFYQIGLIGRRDMPLATDPRSGLEMILLRMLAFYPLSPATSSTPAPITPTPNRPKLTSTQSPPVPIQTAPGIKLESDPVTHWASIAPQLPLSGLAKQFALNCQLVSYTAETMVFQLAPAHDQLRTQSVENSLLAALKPHYGETLKLQFKLANPTQLTPAAAQAQQISNQQQSAQQSILEDPVVQEIRETFAAQVPPESIRPLS